MGKKHVEGSESAMTVRLSRKGWIEEQRRTSNIHRRGEDPRRCQCPATERPRFAISFPRVQSLAFWSHRKNEHNGLNGATAYQ